MKRAIPVLLMVALLFGASTVSGELIGDAVATVLVTVDPNVTVNVISSVVDAGTVQTGDFEATIVFRIDANQQQLNIQIEATPLYKGNDPLEETVDPIPLANLPATISPTDAAPMNGLSNDVPLNISTGSIDGFPSQLSAPLRFESSQNNHFSQDVYVTVRYVQVDPEQPVGEYGGRVRIIVILDGYTGTTPP